MDQGRGATLNEQVQNLYLVFSISFLLWKVGVWAESSPSELFAKAGIQCIAE